MPLMSMPLLFTYAVSLPLMSMPLLFTYATSLPYFRAPKMPLMSTPLLSYLRHTSIISVRFNRHAVYTFYCTLMMMIMIMCFQFVFPLFEQVFLWFLWS